MRIIGGKYKGRRLFATINQQVRPTSDRVKESVFNILNEECLEADVLDVFCGSGALGLEALSRGANQVVFIDKDIENIKKNIEWIEEKDDIQVIKGSAIPFLKKTSLQFDLIFLDPPWKESSLFDHALKAIFDFDILKSKGIIICEHKKKIINFESYSILRQVTYGQKMITLIKGNQ